MQYDIAHFWVALLIAFALGCGLSWSTRSQDPRSGTFVQPVGGRWAVGALLFAGGLVLAIFHALTGRPGLWLETALLLFSAYALGYAVTGLLATTAAFLERPVATFTSARTPAAGEKVASSSVTSLADRRGRMVLPAAAIAVLSVLLLATAYVRRRFNFAGRRKPS